MFGVTLQFLAFELKQAESSPTGPGGEGQGGVASPDAVIQRVLAIIKNAHQFGVDLVLVLRNAISALEQPKK